MHTSIRGNTWWWFQNVDNLEANRGNFTCQDFTSAVRVLKSHTFVDRKTTCASLGKGKWSLANVSHDRPLKMTRTIPPVRFPLQHFLVERAFHFNIFFCC